MCPIWHAKLFPECFQEKSYPDCGEFGINQAGMDKRLCILQFIILNFTDLRHDHSSLTGLLFSLESSREKMFTRLMSIIDENLLNKKTYFKHQRIDLLWGSNEFHSNEPHLRRRRQHSPEEWTADERMCVESAALTPADSSALEMGGLENQHGWNTGHLHTEGSTIVK